MGEKKQTKQTIVADIRNREVRPSGEIDVLSRAMKSKLAIKRLEVDYQNGDIYVHGRTGRAFRAFPGRPWHRTQYSIGHEMGRRKGEKE